jgi:succinoglycan biosynthesis protein ExoA
VSENLPSVSVIIAAKPDQARIQAVQAAQRLDYPPERLEIIVARGKHPSVQRNTAMKAVHSDWIYFLDDDSVPEPSNLRRVIEMLGDPAVGMVGGPNLCPRDAPSLQQVFAVVLGSWLAFGPSRARYVAVGSVRPTNEKELILCNLMVRRAALLELGGFNEALYPNEENALMDELRKRGSRLMYDPQFIVYRHPRSTLKAFARMLMTYGRGRAEQFRVHPTPGSMLNFVPPLFCLYLIALLVVEFAMPGTRAVGWSAAPLAAYIFAVLLQTLVSALPNGAFRALAALPLLVASHVLYGLGFWRGLTTRLNRSSDRTEIEVRLEKVSGVPPASH